MTEVSPISWSAGEYEQFGTVPMVSSHSYHTQPTFSREKLVDLLDAYPRKWLQAFTMGEDPCNPKDWKSVDIAPHTTGDDLWQAVQNGRLWLNLTHVEEVSSECDRLIAHMYEHLGEKCPHLQNPQASYSTLLISSPNAQVYFHVDSQPNMLWHLHGNKHVWVYPDMDSRLTPQEMLEDIYAGEIDEDLPYDPAYDALATEFVLKPGDVVSWPHNAPHRVVNIDMNVSLTTSYYTPAIYKRQYVQLANRFLMRGLGIRNRSMDEHGVMPSIKRITYRLVNKIRPFKRRDRSSSYVTDLQIDPNAPLGYRKTSTTKPASFSRQADNNLEGTEAHDAVSNFVKAASAEDSQTVLR